MSFNLYVPGEETLEGEQTMTILRFVNGSLNSVDEDVPVSQIEEEDT